VGEFVWTPTPEQVESANITRLARRLGVERYHDLHRISIEEPERFWPAVVEDLGLEFSEPWTDVVDVSRGPEWATWFVGGKLNLAWNCVHRWAAGELAEEEAAVWLAEDGGRVSLTWRELSEEVCRLAEGLASIGIGPGDAVGIYLPMSPQVAIASHACAHLGAVQVPIFSGFAAPAIAARLADAKAKALITADGSLRRGHVVAMKETADEAVQSAPTVTHTVVWRRLGLDDVPMTIGRDRWWDELVADTSGGLSPVQVSSEQPYLLAYTSGTTGKPKGVRLVHDNWVYEGKAVAALNILGPDDVQYLWLPMSHVLGKVLSAVQLEFGFSTAVDGDLSRIVENLGTIKPTFMGGAPRIFEKVRAKVTLTAQGEGGLRAKIFNWAVGVGIKASRLRQEGKQPGFLLRLQLKIADKLVFSKVRERMGGRIRFFISGSAALSQDVYEWFDAVGMTILEGYGLTETSAAFAVNLPGDSRIATVGPPLPGSQAMIADDGEIMLKGPGVMRGYHNRPDATDEAFTDGWFHSGDIGELVNGYIKITDRKKDLIKTSGGKYVAPQKIEVIFSAECPYSGHIVVHGDGRHFASALITLDDEMIQDWAAKNGLGGKSTAELAKDPQVYALIDEYVQRLNGQLERWETIKKFIILPRDLTIEDGELTPSMKVRRKIVEQKYLSELDSLYK
jgi:long-chain acyl-CoA synthetase